jgi:HK97 gp10 family phage protein
MAKRGTKADVSGGKELEAKFRQISREAKTEIEQALVKGALRVERQAKINAPVNKQVGLGGRLRASITHRLTDGPNGPMAEVGTNVTYGKFQEYGTGQRGKGSGVPTPADYEYGSSKGIPAQPFLFPAYNQNKDKILKDLAAAFKKGCGL